MKKHTVFTLLSIPLVIGVLAGIKFLQIDAMTTAGEQYQTPPVPVTFATVTEQAWETRLHAVGTVAAEDGIMVKAELAGRISRIAFTPGTAVTQGALLVQQDTRTEKAALRSAEAAAELAHSTLQRAQRMLKQNGVSVSDRDTAAAQAKQADAQVETVAAQLEKKSVRAPFAGRLGVLQVSTGQDLREGDSIVMLQKLDPLLVNFTLPQRQREQLQPGLTVHIHSRDFPDLDRQGQISAIDPALDPATRNVNVQARLHNADERLLPGMFVEVDVVLQAAQPVLTVPATAILYAPYGDSVFVIETRPQDQGGGQVVRQQMVKTGEMRGDFVVVTEGLSAGMTVVSTGVFKLMNGQTVTADNRLSPDFSLSPTPDNS